MTRFWKRILQIVLIVIVVLGALAYRDLRAQSTIGAGYVAHQMCSCMFVAGRSHDSCRPDMLPAMDPIQSEAIDRDGQDGVRAWVTLLANRVAIHRPGLGCSLD